MATAEPQREAAVTVALAELRQSITGLLSAPQRSAWEKLCQFPDLPMPYRLAGPNDAQRKQLHKLLEQRTYRLMAAQKPADRDAVEAKFQQELAKVLTGEQQAILSAYHQNSPVASAAIAEAWAPLQVRPQPWAASRNVPTLFISKQLEPNQLLAAGDPDASALLPFPGVEPWRLGTDGPRGGMGKVCQGSA